GDKSLQMSPDFDCVVTPVVIGNDRVEGVVSTKGVVSSFDSKFEYKVAFNANVRGRAPDKKVDAKSGTPLPPGGGEPGKAYLAFNKALAAGDIATLKKMAPKDEPMPPDDEVKKMLPMMQAMAAKNIKILQGFQNGNAATLFVEGETMGQKGKKG